MVAVNELRLRIAIVGLKRFQLVSIVQQKKAPNQWLPHETPISPRHIEYNRFAYKKEAKCK